MYLASEQSFHSLSGQSFHSLSGQGIHSSSGQSFHSSSEQGIHSATAQVQAQNQVSCGLKMASCFSYICQEIFFIFKYSSYEASSKIKMTAKSSICLTCRNQINNATQVNFYTFLFQVVTFFDLQLFALLSFVLFQEYSKPTPYRMAYIPSRSILDFNNGFIFLCIRITSTGHWNMLSK